MSEKNEPVLLPCPFCGAKGMLEPNPDEPGNWQIGCSRWHECIMDTPTYKTMELAIKAWNTRAPDRLPVVNGLEMAKRLGEHVYVRFSPNGMCTFAKTPEKLQQQIEAAEAYLAEFDPGSPEGEAP